MGEKVGGGGKSSLQSAEVGHTVLLFLLSPLETVGVQERKKSEGQNFQLISVRGKAGPRGDGPLQSNAQPGVPGTQKDGPSQAGPGI